MPCSFAVCFWFLFFGLWVLVLCFVCVGFSCMELALPCSDSCSTFEPPKRDTVNAFA